MSVVKSVIPQQKLGGNFQSAAKPTPTQGKAHSTVSVRLTAAERKALERDAHGKRLSAHVRERLFSENADRLSLKARHQQELLAQLLRALARSNLALDLEAIYTASIEKDLPLTRAVEDRVLQACDDVALMRRALVKALGLRPK